jgi:hypothetical protein
LRISLPTLLALGTGFLLTDTPGSFEADPFALDAPSPPSELDRLRPAAAAPSCGRSLLPPYGPGDIDRPAPGCAYGAGLRGPLRPPVGVSGRGTADDEGW